MMQPQTHPELSTLRSFFDSGETRSYEFRLRQLKNLKKSILKHEKEIYDALYSDLKRSPEETWVTETGLAIAELNNAIRNLRRWMQPQRVPTNLVNLPSTSKIHHDPLGVVLIIGPWNYPFQLCIIPLIGAIAAGNCAVIKTSEFSTATTAITKMIIEDCFESNYVIHIGGDGAQVIPSMMNEFRFDHIFYTGNTEVGRKIYKAAADKLVPVTLELGGKSPCVVESDADIKVATRRIAISKFSNAGQMCVAPDYVLVHESIKDRFITQMQKTIHDFFGEDAEVGYGYGKIINARQFDRIKNYLKENTIVSGGRINEETRFIEPTLILNPSLSSPIMKDEIFGPVLPIIPFREREDAMAVIRNSPDPLAFYIFTADSKKEKQWLQTVRFGGGCVNNTSWHLTNHHLPFGGIGTSGLGSYHGKSSFETFSHRKSVMKTPTWFDPAMKYPPFKGKLKLFKWIIR
jgi:aldehyde dehydrogenase (NAD+)